MLSLNDISALLRVVVLDQLRAQNVDHSLTLVISWDYGSSLGEVLRLGELKLDLFLALLNLVVVGENISDFLLVLHCGMFEYKINI
jgi:hypothetical protein